MARFALDSLLADSFEIEALACRSEALDLLRDIGGFDVALVDVRRRAPTSDGEPTGIETVRAIRRRESAVGIVARGTHATRHLAGQAIRAGATSYIGADALPEQVRKAVLQAAELESFMDPSLPAKGGRGKLTQRQCEILQMLSDGQSISRAARSLSVSEETVKTHMKHILGRLGAGNRAHAVAIALRAGLIE